MTRRVLNPALVLSLLTTATLLLMGQDEKYPIEANQTILDPHDSGHNRRITITDKQIIKNGSSTDTYNQVPAVVETSNGDYLLSYNVGLDHVVSYYHVLRRSHDNGGKWTAEIDQWSATSPDPTLARAPLSGDALVSFADLTTTGLIGAAYARSHDNGHTWSGFTFFDNPVNDTFSTPTRYLVDGLNMYAAGYDGLGLNATLWFSGDDGYTWAKLSTIDQPGDAAITETGIAKIGRTTLLAISRDAVNTHTWGHISADMGLTWGPQIDYTPQVGALDLPQLLQVRNALLLFGRNGNANELLAFVSNDGGKTFTHRTVLDTYTGEGIDGGYCWPLLRRDGKIFVVYYADSQGLRKPDIKSLIVQWK
jgi:hypothetical protein